MCNMRILLTIAFLSTGLLTKAETVLNINSDQKSSLYASIERFQLALEKRNFKLAHEEIDELMPLIKSDIKEDKKELKILMKAEEGINTDLIQKTIDKKISIQEELVRLASASSAALRVKADEANVLVQSYLAVLEVEPLLVSSSQE
ncbi:MAG: hypothetical protein ACI8QD_001560 [Cyclobacteriaceae bacterium]|jgi:hypothetical protein